VLQLQELMEDVYHGDVPKSEVVLLRKWLTAKARDSSRIYWHEFVEALE
jgi:hypothetical protein